MRARLPRGLTAALAALAVVGILPGSALATESGIMASAARAAAQVTANAAQEETRWEPRVLVLIVGGAVMASGYSWMRDAARSAEGAEQRARLEDLGVEWDVGMWTGVIGAGIVAVGLIGKRVPVSPSQSVTFTARRGGGALQGVVSW